MAGPGALRGAAWADAADADSDGAVSGADGASGTDGPAGGQQ
jgi:hypothetical protein